MSGFLGSHILEAAIGLSLVYLMLSVLCTTVNEWIVTLLNSRAATLRTAVYGLLDNQSADGRLFTELFYSHPLISGLMKQGSHPSYLPPHAFSNAILDLVTAGTDGSIVFADVRAGIERLPHGDVRTALFALIQNAEGDLHKAQVNIEAWFNHAMDRASGWYKQRMQWFTLVIGAALTIFLNADSLTMIHRLWLAQPGTLIGWDSIPHGTHAWFVRASGWILTTGAVSLGSPFWFDVLNRFVRLRSAQPTAGK